jgi:hypothetical protein
MPSYYLFVCLFVACTLYSVTCVTLDVSFVTFAKVWLKYSSTVSMISFSEDRSTKLLVSDMSPPTTGTIHKNKQKHKKQHTPIHQSGTHNLNSSTR